MNHIPESLYERRDSLVSLSNSLLKHYGVTPFHPTCEAVDKVLKGHRKICVFLFDGAGKYNLSLYPTENAFLLSHAFHTIQSTNPSTTVAATTAFLTAKWPCETGWLGWSLYMEKLGYPVDVFPNVNSLSGAALPFKSQSYMEEYCPKVTIDSLLQEAGVKAKLSFVAPIGGTSAPKNIEEMGEQATHFFQKEAGEFLYSYSTLPDQDLHHYGVKSEFAAKDYYEINQMVRRFTEENPDVLVLTMADHGLIDVVYQDLATYPKLASCLYRPLSIEGRNVALWVKEEKRDFFAKEFAKSFPDFLLLNRQEVLENGYFGEGKPSLHFEEFIGDFQALALGNSVLVNSFDAPIDHVLKAHHAGGTKEEREILLGLFLPKKG